jgi:Tetracyclin repressor-like, C-terminal domain
MLWIALARAVARWSGRSLHLHDNLLVLDRHLDRLGDVGARRRWRSSMLRAAFLRWPSAKTAIVVRPRRSCVASPAVHGSDLTEQENAERLATSYCWQVRQAQRDLEGAVARLEATCLAYVGYTARFPHRYALLFGTQRDREEKSAVGDRGAAALQTLVDCVADCKAAGLSGSVDPHGDALAIWSAIKSIIRCTPHPSP